MNNIQKQIKIIKSSYNQTFDNYIKGISDLDLLPENFKNSKEFKKLTKIQKCSSNNPDIKKYLNPKKEMKFLDVGSNVNLISYKLYNWPSIYYGIDISNKLINTVKNFVKKNKINIGNLYISQADKTKFKDHFFDILSCIGILEYFDIIYIEECFKEFNRILKSNSKLVIDFPNQKHPCFKTMVKLENYLNRPRYNLPTNKEFETLIKKYFIINHINSKSLMIKYFLKKLN